MEFYKVGLIHCTEHRGEVRNYYISCPKLSKEKRPKGRYELGRLYKSPRIRKIGEKGRKNIFLSEGRVMNLGNSNRVAYLLSVFQKL